MKNIAVFTCNRADEGPMGPVVKALKARGLNVIRCPGESAVGADCLLLLGDRHELLLAAHDALLMQIPIAHIHGGETTLGSFDDKVRNAVSQLADIHFTAAQVFSDKLAAMGIAKGRIHTVGPPGLDDLETEAVSEFGSGHFLVCLHPDTTQDEAYNWSMANETRKALKRFDRRVVVIRCNDDPGGGVINGTMAVDWQPIDLPRRRYLTALKHASVCIGNSSSFVIEAPALGTPSVLVGDRQKGRPLARTVFEAAPTADCIEYAIDLALEQDWALDAELPYGRGGASQKIADILANWSP